MQVKQLTLGNCCTAAPDLNLAHLIGVEVDDSILLNCLGETAIENGATGNASCKVPSHSPVPIGAMDEVVT